MATWGSSGSTRGRFASSSLCSSFRIWSVSALEPVLHSSCEHRWSWLWAVTPLGTSSQLEALANASLILSTTGSCDRLALGCSRCPRSSVEPLPSYHWTPYRTYLTSLRPSICDSDCFPWSSSRSCRAQSRDVTQTSQRLGLQWKMISEYRLNLSFQLSSSEVAEGS